MDHNSGLPNQIPMQEILRFAASPSGQQLIAMMRQQGGKEFQKTMETASNGDYTQAKHAIEKLLKDPKAQQLLNEFGR